MSRITLFALTTSLAACTLDGLPVDDTSDSGRTAAAAATPLDSSAMIIGEWDWARRADGGSRCTDMVDRAAAAGSTTVNFVPTHYFRAYESGTGTSGRPLWQVQSYCYRRGQGECVDFTWAAIEQFRADMQACMARAVGHGLDLAVVPHLDDGYRQGVWRNSVDFDPSAKHAGFSYADVLLYPLADAARDAMGPSTRVYFAMQGEMGATVFAHPGAYDWLAGELRQRIAGGDAARASRIQVGVSINFNFVTGGVHGVDQGAVANLFRNADFIGLSSYGPVDPHPRPENFDTTLDNFAGELSNHGVDLQALHAQGQNLHFSEFGVGGGVSGAGVDRASTRSQAAAAPYFGVYGAYESHRDPWVGDVGQFRRDFYDAGLRYLREGGRWRVDRAFIWSLDSWDVQAVYPTSASSQGSYRDAVIVERIAEHNRRALDDDGGEGAPWCRDHASDPDGDGWGWEDGQSCRTYPHCTDPAADLDGDGWGWENDASCRVACTDVAPPDGSTCAQQRDWGKCDADWMLANGWCAQTCGRC